MKTNLPPGLVTARNSGEPSFSVTRRIESSRSTNVLGSASIWFFFFLVREPLDFLRCKALNLALKPKASVI